MSSVAPEGIMGSVTTLGVRGKLAGNGCESEWILEADERSIDLKYGP